MEALFKMLFLVAAFTLLTSSDVLSHEVVEHSDPELLIGWQIWLHLTIQWTHLVAFSLWLGLSAGTLLLGIKPSLDQLLYSSWILLLVILATGTYNMEWSAGISKTPTLLLLPLLERIPYGVTYTVILAIKLGFYTLTVIITLILTLLHLQGQVDKNKLRQIFLSSGAFLGVFIAFMTSIVLLFHEVADLWPTALHSSGGVVGPEGPRGQIGADQNVPPPNDFRPLATQTVWIDIGVRWVHLLGFGLWLGGNAVALVFNRISPGRFLLYSWIALIIQVLSGIASMGRWTPFYLSPYAWNLDELSHLRFGRIYTLFMATKHILVIMAISLTVIMTVRYHRIHSKKGTDQLGLQPFVVVGFFLGLAIGYIMIIVLLLHEGVDHAL